MKRRRCGQRCWRSVRRIWGVIILVHCRQQVDKARLDETIREITQHSSPYSFNMHLLLTFTKQHLLLTLTTQHYHPVILSQHSSPYPLFHPPFLPPTLSPTLLLGLLSVLLILAGNLAMLLGKLGKFEEAKDIYGDILQGYDQVGQQQQQQQQQR